MQEFEIGLCSTKFVSGRSKLVSSGDGERRIMAYFCKSLLLVIYELLDKVELT